MKVHEYQARDLLAQAGVPVPNGVVVESAEQAQAACEKIGGGKVVVKAQVYAGGRGKAGYVKLCDSPRQVEEACRFMFGKPMVSVQTGPAGVKVRKIMIAQAVEIAHEYYLGIVLDRTKRQPVVMASRQGGVEIEEVAKRDPAAIIKQWMHPHLGLQEFQVRALVAALGFDGEQARQAGQVIRKLAGLFVAKDCTLAEINPLVLTKDGKVLAIDAKMNFDDSAIFRHSDLQKAMYDRDRRGEPQRDPRQQGQPSTTSPSTAGSAAWSTAPAWRCRRWTSSSCTAASQPTSSMSAAA